MATCDFARRCNRCRHRDISGNLAHGIVGVDDDRRAIVAHDDRPAARIDATVGQLLDIIGHPSVPCEWMPR